jgi:hypothetical protein
MRKGVPDEHALLASDLHFLTALRLHQLVS